VSYTIKLARYSKGNMAVVCESNGTGYKTRCMRLAEVFSNGRYTGREHAYIMSVKAAERFEQAVKDGWDATSVTGELHDGKYGPVKHRKSVKAKEPIAEYSKVIAEVDTRGMVISMKDAVYIVTLYGEPVQPNMKAEDVIRYLAHILYNADHNARNDHGELETLD